MVLVGEHMLHMSIYSRMLSNIRYRTGHILSHHIPIQHQTKAMLQTNHVDVVTFPVRSCLCPKYQNGLTWRVTMSDDQGCCFSHNPEHLIV